MTNAQRHPPRRHTSGLWNATQCGLSKMRHTVWTLECHTVWTLDEAPHIVDSGMPHIVDSRLWKASQSHAHQTRTRNTHKHTHTYTHTQSPAHTHMHRTYDIYYALFDYNLLKATKVTMTRTNEAAWSHHRQQRGR